MTQQTLTEATPATEAVLPRTGGAETQAEPRRDEPAAEALIAEELLVEEVSIDGMCGVY
jgi:mycofactocin precursor